MTTKEYLSQARFLDARIDSKIQQAHMLKTLATRCTTTLSDMPKSPSPNASSMEVIICKIIELEEEINRDIDRLVDLKRNITRAIKQVRNPEYQTLLEKRYLCFETWENIAVEMRYEIRYIHKLHNKALHEVKVPETSFE